MRRLIKIREIIRRTSLSRSTINRYASDPKLQFLRFPKPVMLGLRDRGWYEDEFERWLESLPAASPPERPS